jgi:hypothetical protein
MDDDAPDIRGRGVENAPGHVLLELPAAAPAVDGHDSEGHLRPHRGIVLELDLFGQKLQVQEVPLGMVD